MHEKVEREIHTSKISILNKLSGTSTQTYFLFSSIKSSEYIDFVLQDAEKLSIVGNKRQLLLDSC